MPWVHKHSKIFNNLTSIDLEITFFLHQVSSPHTKLMYNTLNKIILHILLQILNITNKTKI